MRVLSEGPIKIYVAATPAEWLPAKVLEFSILETASKSFILKPIYTFNRVIPMPKALENQPRTPFSFQRFLIPELNHYSGKAIYLDADMQVFQDISALWDWPLSGCDLQTVQPGNRERKGQFSVMLLDCEQLKWDVDAIVADLDSGRLSYSALMYEMRIARNVGMDISPVWNSLEEFKAGNTALLHYTDMNTQPWIACNNPLDYLWVACLRRAIAKGFITREELNDQISSGYIRPSLACQIDIGIDSASNLSKSDRNLDKNFTPPYKLLHSGKAYPWTSPLGPVKAFLRRNLRNTILSRFFA